MPGEDFSAVVATGPNGGWAFGSGMPGADPRPTAWRRSGPSWTLVPFPGQREEVVITAAATSASDVWAFTTGGARSRALHWGRPRLERGAHLRPADRRRRGDQPG